MKTKRAPRIQACSYACCASVLPADPAREAEVVADQRARARPGRRSRPGRRPSCGAPPTRRRPPPKGPAGPAPTITRSNVLAARARRRSRHACELCVRGVGERPAVGKHDHRERPVRHRLGEDRRALRRVGEGEAVGQRAALEGAPELVGAARPRVADDVDRVGGDALVVGPLERGSSRPPGGTARPAAAGAGRGSGRCARGRSPPRSRRRSPRRPSRPTRSAARASPAGGSAVPRRGASTPVVSPSHGAASTSATCDALAGERLEPCARLRGGGEADDLVVARVAVVELALDVAQARRRRRRRREARAVAWPRC